MPPKGVGSLGWKFKSVQSSKSVLFSRTGVTFPSVLTQMTLLTVYSVPVLAASCGMMPWCHRQL